MIAIAAIVVGIVLVAAACVSIALIGTLTLTTKALAGVEAAVDRLVDASVVQTALLRESAENHRLIVMNADAVLAARKSIDESMDLFKRTIDTFNQQVHEATAKAESARKKTAAKTTVN